MILRRISYTIALQFTAFVFLLFLVNGAIFLAADIGNARRQTAFRLSRTAHFIIDQASTGPEGIRIAIPPPMRDRVRVTDASGGAIYSGNLFGDEPFEPQAGEEDIRIQNEDFHVLTMPIIQNGVVTGYVQVADAERLPLGDLPIRAVLYLLVSAAISALTFVVGLFFARRSLKPAEQMMERLEQFTQDASHELRTPLAALSSSLDLALKNKKYHEGIVSAKEDVKDVAALVERLLELARLDSFGLQMQPVDLSLLAEQVAAKHRPLAAERHVKIETDLADGVTVEGDAALLKQVLTNLLSNAIKFSKPEGGTVRIHLTPTTLSVADEGIGIAPADLAQVFDRFYQVDESRAHGGYGLGLALVKRIVDLHGWTIAVRSTKGKGATFTVSLRP